MPTSISISRTTAGVSVNSRPSGSATRRRRATTFSIGGAPTDHNAKLIREGQLSALKDAMQRGDIEIVCGRLGQGLDRRRGNGADRGGAEEGAQPDRGRRGVERHHGRRCYSRARESGTCRQGLRLRAGRQPRCRPPHRRRDADDDRLQAAQAARARRRVSGLYSSRRRKRWRGARPSTTASARCRRC